MVIYFSGTGNSRYIARKIAEKTDDQIIDIFTLSENKASFKSEKPYVFVAPTHAYNIPPLFEEFISKSSFSGSKKAYFAMTCGDTIGKAKNPLAKLCKNKGFDFMGVRAFVMPENYICMFDSPANDEAEKIIAKADSVLDGLISAIKAEKTIESTDGSAFLTYIVNPLFYALCVKDKKFYATDECIACGKCKDICITKNITLENGNPKWHGNCTHCQACISICPKNAIEYGKIAAGKHRYYLYENGTLKQ